MSAELIDIINKVLLDTLQITFLVTVMMIAVDILNVITRQKLQNFFIKAGQFRQYIFSSLIGTVPGCIGGFTTVSLYFHGFISFGALAGSMIAVSGDESFVMLAMFPKDALILFMILFVLGVFSGYLIDKMVKSFSIKTCGNCEDMIVHQEEPGFKHYFVEHIYNHIIKKHIWKTMLWTFAALIIVEYGLKYLNLEHFTSQYKILFLIVGALVGLIPESGPHLIFVTLFAQGLVPFSVLFTSSVVQDGHGMLPMLSYSFKDYLLVKAFNLAIGLSLGIILFLIGI